MTIEFKLEHANQLAHSLQIRAHTLKTDISEAEKGNGAAPSFHDLHDAALGACKVLTVLWHARKRGSPSMTSRPRCRTNDHGGRSGIYRLAVKLKLQGALSDAQLMKLQALADKCPVHKMMTKVTTEISTEVERLA